MGLDKNTIKVNVWRVVSDAVERGVEYGLALAHKHTDDPTRDEVAARVEAGVMEKLSEVLEFDET